MRSKIAYLCFIWIFPLLLICHPSPVFAVEDAIIAVVNDGVITYKDLMDYVKSIVTRMHLEGRSRNEIESRIEALEKSGLEKLIETRLIITEADTLGMEIDKRAVDTRIDEIKERYDSEDQFLEAIIAQGASVSDMRAKIEDEFKVKYLVDMEVREKIFINPQEVTDYYNENMDAFVKEETARLESIYVPAGENKEEGLALAQEALNKIKEGTAFVDAASEYSQAPSIGTIEKGQMLSEIEDVVFSLKAGEMSDVIEVEGGFFIIQLMERTASRQRALEEVKEQIETQLFEQKYQEDLKKWLNKLQDKAFIEIK